ncbi:hypothetical protein B0T20DRAFT_417926 [Sordaria brevicollis]|uniref:Uncharacterized protein n=1 Tax=Sordaria brevicollis TaxID=83679 RepID=A0AAE0PAX5_SORBR|nr:hypothetical protein B0T20DRAFT_417926 [Sordaria brevicollis]
MSMMDPTQKTLEAVQKVLQPYLRPREEVAHIRRILTLHLSSGLKDGSPLTEPLSLTKSSELPSYPPEIRGPYREYLEALSANIKARAEYQALSQKLGHYEGSELEKEGPQPNYLLSHLASLKAQKKHEKLLVVEKNLDILRQKPATSPDFLSQERIFTDCRPLPEVPTEVVNSLALEQTSEDITASKSLQLKDLSDSLEHRTFQTNLSLKQEEVLLEKAKSVISTVQPENISPEAKLQALNAARTELINWIEAELGKASGDGGKGETTGQDDGNNKEKADHLNQQLTSIKSKYAQYLTERKALLELVTTRLHSSSSFKFPTITTSSFPLSSSASAPPPRVSSPERPSSTTQPATEESTPPPIDHLLTPTLSSLLTLSHSHKSLLANKAHIFSLLSKQARENAQVLDHLAEESHMLPAYGQGHTMQTRDDGKETSTQQLVKPWVTTADAAKLQTFQVVAEKIEEGQVALEGAMRVLGEADRLLGRGPREQHQQEKSVGTAAGGGGDEEDEKDDDEDVGEESDIWLVEARGEKPFGGGSGNGLGLVTSGIKGHGNEGGRKAGRHRESGVGSVWDMLDLDVGLGKRDGSKEL